MPIPYNLAPPLLINPRMYIKPDEVTIMETSEAGIIANERGTRLPAINGNQRGKIYPQG